MKLVVARLGVTIALAALAAGCGQKPAAGTGTVAAPEANEENKEAPAADSPEADVTAAKAVAVDSMTSLINAATDPEIKAALEIGLKRLEKMDTKEALETFNKLYEGGAAGSLNDVKTVNALTEVFELQADPSAEKIDFSGASMALADLVIVNPENLAEMKKSLLDTLSAVLKTPVENKYDYMNGPILPILIAQCYVTGNINDVQGWTCNTPKKNFWLGMFHWNFYRQEILDYFLADELEPATIRDRAGIVGLKFGDLVENQDVVGFNWLEAFKEVQRQVRSPVSIGGTLTSTGDVTLQLNGKNDFAAKNGAFTFPTKVNLGGKYNVTVLTPPTGQTCEVTSGSGRATTNKTSVNVTCKSAARTIGGSVSGLPSGGAVTLLLNGANELSVSTDGAFTFVSSVNNNATYAVTVKTNPTGYLCTVAGDTGTASANVSNVAVTCVSAKRDVSASVSGMSSGTLTLKLNDGSPLAITANGTSKFSTQVDVGAAFAVTVYANPPGKSCSVPSGSGTISDNVTVEVNCVTLSYNVGGSVSGLGSGSVVLRLNGANDKTISANGAYNFTPQLAYGASYAVTVHSSPANHTCTVANDAGTMAGTVANANITCTALEFTLKVDVSGLTGGTLTLRNNINLNSKPVTTNGLQNFSQKITANDGYDYDVRILGQPAGQTCVLSGDVGTASADVTVTATCSAAPATYSVGGTVLDIPVGQSVTLRLTYGGSNIVEDFQVDYSIPSNPVTFDFLADLSNGDAYTVTVNTQPGSATCTVDSGGSGTITGANVTDVVVTCI